MSRWSRLFDRLTGAIPAPDGFAGTLDADEHIVATADVAGGGHLVLTQLGLWVPGEPARRVGWQWVSKAAWDRDAVVLTEATEDGEPGEAGTAVLLRDLPPVRFTLTRPGRVPQVLRERVTGSIRSSQHRELPGGGAWFVQRRVPGRDGVVLQVRADPGTDRATVRAVAESVAAAVGNARPER